ncbi:MAG: FHA domain-containing protein [Pseudomonadota bacterium]
MKFIRELMSRKPKEEPVAEAPMTFDEDVTPFEEVINKSEPKQRLSDFDAAASAPLERSAKLEVRKEQAPAPAPAPEPRSLAQDVGIEESAQILKKLSSRLDESPVAPAPSSGVNIWDIEDENDTVEAQPSAAPAARRRRNATRVLGFDASAGSDVVSMFEETAEAAPAPRAKFPVGWMLVADGPGRGECFTLEAGMSQIGRGEDQAIQLDFGDNSISRTNHAAIVYDTESHSFSLGHGGKKNVVRLNGQPVISNETLKSGDKIKIGETTLHFVPCCTEDFNWAEDKDSGENDNVAIA